MKSFRFKPALLTVAAAVVGVGMGASVARATHPPIKLNTYEEVANQFGLPGMGVPAMPVLVNFPLYPTNPMMGMPYSPKQTCGAAQCHDGKSRQGIDTPYATDANDKFHGKVLKGYDEIAQHAFHGAMGSNEIMDNDPSGYFVTASGKQTGLNPQKPWLQSHGHIGKWCPPSLRQVANIEKNDAGQTIEYPNAATFVNGGGTANPQFGKVDNSMWEMATVCDTCHVGGGMAEHDREGVRLSNRQIADMKKTSINPFTATVWEQYDSVTGDDHSFTDWARWTYPATTDNKAPAANGSNAIVPFDLLTQMGFGPALNAMGITKTMLGQGTQALGTAFGALAGQQSIPGATGAMNIQDGQLMMPNVREMDCLFCHLSGYNNVMASVMIQAGQLNAAAAVGAGLLDMQPLSPTYQGYNASKVTLADATGMFAGKGMKEVYLNFTSMVTKINAKPSSDNCMQCHATKELKDFTQMFTGFLSAAPMIYDPTNPSGPTGKRMPSFDLNAPWLAPGMVSPKVDFAAFMTDPAVSFGLGTSLGAMPMAFGPTASNASNFAPGVYPANGFLGGGNPGQSGPMYFGDSLALGANHGDQNVLKRSNYPFPRAEWFKRGDAWESGRDVHTSFGCAGCHFTNDTMGDHKNQCDPGRGFDMLSGIEDGVPPLKDRKLVTSKQGGFRSYSGLQTPQEHDTRNTVKRCEFCHLTGKDWNGNRIDNFGAPNPTAAHAKYGLTQPMVQMVDKYEINKASLGNGGYGGEGISTVTDFTTGNNKLNPTGNHLDVMDCSVCHVTKDQNMAVRALDGTSGLRFPVVIGTDMSKGMLGMFENPASEAVNDAARDQMNAAYAQINAFRGYSSPGNPGYMAPIPAGAGKDINGNFVDESLMIGGRLKGWQPIHMWQKLGNMGLPLTVSEIGAPLNGTTQMNFRRKITLGNAITAIIWNNTDPNVDGNGDGVPGGILDETKPSLQGYTQIFDNRPVDKNNTQGYGEPIFDQWLMHDLKDGMKFSATGFSPVPIGFNTDGLTGYASGQFDSAYNDDFSFSGKSKWVGIWGGDQIMTEPDQIRAYKQSRNKKACGNENGCSGVGNKGWQGTKLTYYGVTFLVTHGVQPATKYAVGSTVTGKGCADCHAKGSGFFNGSFNMVGSAIPAGATFNPTTTYQNNADGYPALDANGEPIIANAGEPMMASPTTLMQRPLQWIPRVKAYNGDLVTGFECFNKLGQPRTVKFEQSNGTYTWTTNVAKSDVLYPADDGAIYYRITDLNADGTPKAGATKYTGQQYADYLENQALITAAANGVTTGTYVIPTPDAPPVNLNLPPVAAISLDGGSTFYDGKEADATIDQTYTKIVADANNVLTNTSIGPFTRKVYNNAYLGQATTGVPFNLKAKDAGTGATYAWTVNTSKAEITDASSPATTITFGKAGVYQLTLTVKNASTGKSSRVTQRINVETPQVIVVTGLNKLTNTVTPANITVTQTLDPYSTAAHPIPIVTIPSIKIPFTTTVPFGKVKMSWGDNTPSDVYDVKNPIPAGGPSHVFNIYNGIQDPNSTTGGYLPQKDATTGLPIILPDGTTKMYKFQTGAKSFQFNVNIQIFNGLTGLGSKTFTVKVNLN